MSNNDERGNEQQQSDPPGHPEAPEVPAVHFQEPPEESSEKDSAKEKKRGRRYETILGFPTLDVLQVLFNLVLMITAVIGAVVIFRQLNLMEEQMADSRKAAAEQDKITARTLAALEKQAAAMTDSIGPASKDAAAAAKTSASSTEKLAKSSEETGRATQLSQEIARSEQRALLVVVGADIMPVGGHVYQPAVRIINSGRSVARNVRAHMRIEVYEAQPYARDYRENTAIARAGNTTRRVALQPGEVFTADCTVPDEAGPFDDSGNPRPVIMDLATIKRYTADGRIVVSGEVTYTDIFEVQRDLTFCYAAEWGAGYPECRD